MPPYQTWLVMMILTDPRKDIWIVPGISQDSCNENWFTEPNTVHLVVTLQSQNDYKLKWLRIHIKWVHTKQKYLLNTIITTIFWTQEKIIIESMPKSEVFLGYLLLSGAYKDSEWNGVNQRGIAPSKIVARQRWRYTTKSPWQFVRFQPLAMEWVGQRSVERYFHKFAKELTEHNPQPLLLMLRTLLCASSAKWSTQKWKVGRTDHRQYRGLPSKGLQMDSAIINAFLEVWNWRNLDTPFNLMSGTGTIAFDVVLKV